MNLAHALLWGVAATIVLTTTMAAAMGLGLTRMNIPFMLGAMWSGDRSRAKVIGFVFNLVNGWIFALFYIVLLSEAGLMNVWAGVAAGLVHALFVLMVGLPLLPYVHPRMATEERGPDPTRQLEPPGFMALHYGRGTPVVTILAHLLYGGIIGAFYR